MERMWLNRTRLANIRFGKLPHRLPPDYHSQLRIR